MTRLVVVLPLVSLRVGETFAVSHWPLHVTVLPPFHTGATVARITAAIRSGTSGQVPVKVVAGPDELFGRRHDVPVTLVADDGQLNALHRALVNAVLPLAAQPDEPAFTGSGFRPHITMKAHGRVHEGDEFLLKQIAVVDMAPRSSPGRQVLATVTLPAE